MLRIEEIGWLPPELACAALSRLPCPVWLDSAASGDRRATHSYVAADPFAVLSGDNDPFTALAAALAPWRIEPGQAPVPFAGGAVGFLGYEARRHVERQSLRHADDLGIPEHALGLYDTVLAYDHAAHRAYLIASGFPATDPAARARRADARIIQFQTLLARPTSPPPALPPVTWRAELGRAAYIERIERALAYIVAGDIFQMNLTQRHLACRPAGLDPLAAHLALREKSPAPFSALLNFNDFSIASVSPERFLRLTAAGGIETRPIKGTRPRHAEAGPDAALAQNLADSAKDRAENLMIVDLMRNDIGRVAEIGSIHVPDLFGIEAFASVHHMVSEIRGRLRPGLTAVDLLRATFPGGSVTGAPKIRAMEIIDELEPGRRGPYCGSILWLGFDGAMDSSIVIRTLVLGHTRVIAQAGGAIVADSEPAAEYDEAMLKIAPLLRALSQ